MKIELHILQNLSPSNLNRDDTGSPKDCEFGGVRRARVSSQCWKRAVRDAFEAGGDFAPGELAVRTKRLVDAVVEALGRGGDEPAKVVKATLEGAGLGLKEDDKGALKTQYLLFVPARSIGALAKVIEANWDELARFAAAAAEAEPAADAEADDDAGDRKGKAKGKAKTAKQEKAEKKRAFPPAIAKEVAAILADGSRTPDLALFGRMIADKPDWNVDAACQVAHAVSTNRMTMEFDFYTAVDDRRADDTTGSDMMGTVQFNSACFYRFAVVDVGDLRRNLAPGGDAAKADPAAVRRTVEGFVRAFVRAIPTGKQNSMAAHNPPSYVLAVVRERGVPVALTNAFVKPVRPTEGADLVTGSIEALEGHLRGVAGMYGTAGVAAAVTAADRPLGAADLGGGVALARAGGVDELVSVVVARALGGGAAT